MSGVVYTVGKGQLVLAVRRLVFTLAIGLSLWAAGSDVDRAEDLFQRTNYQSALNLLLAPGHTDAASYFVIGKSYFMLGEFKKASEYFEKAVAVNPNRSDYFHWLGRAYGRRAETSTFVTAPSYAAKARQNFEKAVDLDPKNGEAINDLFDYYLQAPGFLGGGVDKASNLVTKIGALDKAEAHYAQAQIALHKKEMRQAEQQLRTALELAPRQVGRVLDLAKFLSKQGKVQESEAMFAKAEQLAPNDPKVLYERAATYIEQKRNLDVAKSLLEKYLHSNLTPEHPSRAAAERLLKQTAGM